MESNPDFDYKLGRDGVASGRLTMQHWLYTELWGLIRPEILESWKEEDPPTPKRIADVACGNAVWSIEVAESNLVRDVEVTGFDVSTAQFPPENHLPSNVTLKTWNIFDPPPEEYEGYFDLVNIRLLSFVIPNGNPRPVLQNVFKLLKPGGFLTWVEYDLLSPDVAPDSSYRRIWDILAASAGPSDHQWIQQLDSLFTECGLKDAKMLVRTTRKSRRKYWVDSYCMSFQELLKSMHSQDVVDVWIACEKEREQGVLVAYPTNFAIGRKPN